MRLGTPYAPRPPIVNINIFGGVGGGSEGARGSGGLLACNVSVFCWNAVLATLAWEASTQGPLQPPCQPDRCQPQSQCFTNCRMIVMTARARARARPRVMERTRAKTLSPRSAREKRFFPKQQQKSFTFCKYCCSAWDCGSWCCLQEPGPPGNGFQSWPQSVVQLQHQSSSCCSHIFAQDENILLEFWSSKIKQGEMFNWLKN